MHVAAFVRGLARAQLPDAVVAHARRCLLDLCGVAAAGWRTPASSSFAESAFRASAAFGFASSHALRTTGVIAYAGK